MEMIYYEKLGIYDLRNAARELGVERPTTLKKSELIAQIEKIKSGEKEPCFSTLGRYPIKKPISKGNIENSIKNEVERLYKFAKNLAKEFGVEID